MREHDRALLAERRSSPSSTAIELGPRVEREDVANFVLDEWLDRTAPGP
jgi:hypothetical protein